MIAWVYAFVVFTYLPNGAERYELHTAIYRTENACMAAVARDAAAIAKARPEARVLLGDTPCSRETTP